MSEDIEIITPKEYKRPGKYFSDKGEYEVVAGDRVEKGKFEVDTSLAEQLGGDLEWETLLNIYQEGLAVTDDDEELAIPSAYKPQGEVFRLWDLSQDPDGSHAKVIHQTIVDMAKSNIPANILSERIRELRSEIAEILDQEPPKLKNTNDG